MSDTNFDNGFPENLPALPPVQKPNISKYILNLYPSQEAAAAHAKLLQDLGPYEPIRVTYWAIGIGFRHRAWALAVPRTNLIEFAYELMRAWSNTQFVAGEHLPPRPSPTGRYDAPSEPPLQQPPRS